MLTHANKLRECGKHANVAELLIQRSGLERVAYLRRHRYFLETLRAFRQQKIFAKKRILLPLERDLNWRF